MTFEPSFLLKGYLFAIKLNRERALMTAWMATQKPRMERFLPAPEADQAIDEARQHWRKLEGPR